MASHNRNLASRVLLGRPWSRELGLIAAIWWIGAGLVSAQTPKEKFERQGGAALSVARNHGLCRSDASLSSESSLRLELNWLDGNNLFTSGSTRVGRLVEDLFREVGVGIEWLEGDINVRQTPKSPRLRVVLVPSEPSGWGMHANAMGAVFSEGTMQTAVYIFFPALVRGLGYSPKALEGKWLSASTETELTRALARVVAHEVFHAIAPKLPHADKGLTQEKLDRFFLLNGNAAIDPGSATSFRQQLARVTLPFECGNEWPAVRRKTADGPG